MEFYCGPDFIPFALLEKCHDVPPTCLKDLTPPENLIQIEEIDSEHLSPKVSFGQKKGKKDNFISELFS